MTVWPGIWGQGSDENLKNSPADVTAGKLTSKLIVADPLVITTLNPGGNEQSEISMDPDPAFERIILTNPTTPTVRIKLRATGSGGLAVDSDPNLGIFIPWGVVVQTSNVTLPLTGVTESVVDLKGTMREIDTGLTGDYLTVTSILNNHICIKLNSLTGTDIVTITGTSVNESNGVLTPADTEVFTVDEVVNYQAAKKFIELDSIIFGAGITAINYDLEVCGYVDFGNNNFYLAGYRADIKSQSNLGDVRLRIIKFKDLGNNKYETQDLENIGIDSTSGNGQQIDSVRTGGANRDFTFSTTAWPDASTINWKMLDFIQHFQSDGRYSFDGATKNEGFVVRLEGTPTGGLTGVDHISFDLGYLLT